MLTVQSFTTALLVTACQLLVASSLTNSSVMLSPHAEPRQKDFQSSDLGFQYPHNAILGECRIMHPNVYAPDSSTELSSRKPYYEDKEDTCSKHVLGLKIDSTISKEHDREKSKHQTTSLKHKNGFNMKSRKLKGSKRQRKKAKKKRSRLILKKMKIK